MGNQVHPGNLIAMPKNQGKGLDLGIVLNILNESPSPYIKGSITLLRAKTLYKSVPDSYHWRGFRREPDRTILYCSRLALESIILIENPLFDMEIPQVSSLIGNFQEMKDQYFTQEWKPGKAFIVEKK